jgi:glycosyltransferase involved in cell wall biosynthesis
MDLITLAIPIYNVEKYVERALLSALSQTYEHIEYLIIDDKGNDQSMTIVENIVSTHPRKEQVCIIEHPANIGAGGTRNTAIEQAKGKYIFFMDSDDEITSDCIQKLYEEMIRTDVDVVCGSFIRVDGNEITPSNTENFIEKDQAQIVLSNFNNRFPVTVCNKLYKLSFLRENHIRCVPNQTVEDNYYTFQVLINAKSYGVIADNTYYRYMRSDSTTGGGGGWNEKIFGQWVQIFGDLLETLQKSSLDSNLKRQVKKKLFKKRWGISLLAIKSPYPVEHYINDYLNPAFMRDKDTLRSGYLLCACLFSCLPFGIKKICLRFHAKFTTKKLFS